MTFICYLLIGFIFSCIVAALYKLEIIKAADEDVTILCAGLLFPLTILYLLFLFIPHLLIDKIIKPKSKN